MCKKDKTNSALTIGEVSKRTGIGVEAIRYYEKEGLLQKPARTASGYRQYSQEVIKKLSFIVRAKDLGFTLREISELLEMRPYPKTKCADVKIRAEQKLEDIEGRIKTLQRMKRALKQLTLACDGKGATSECPILECLEKVSGKGAC